MGLVTQKDELPPLPDISDKTVWVVTEGLAGTENPCLGLVHAMGVSPVVKRIDIREPWKSLHPHTTFPPFSEKALSSKSDDLGYPWPDLVISSGRKAVLPALWIKKQSGNKTKIVHIQNPRIPPHKFDAVIIPYHDKPDCFGRNVLATDAGLHHVTPEKLEEGRARFIDRFAPLAQASSQGPEGAKGKLIGVLIGGETKHFKIDDEVIDYLVTMVRRLALDGYGVVVTASRRSPDKLIPMMQEATKDLVTQVEIWDGHGDNPYWGILGCADALLVTEDSISMVSEALASGKFTQILKLKGESERFTSFYCHLRSVMGLRVFDGQFDAPPTFRPPQDVTRMAYVVAHLVAKGTLPSLTK